MEKVKIIYLMKNQQNFTLKLLIMLEMIKLYILTQHQNWYQQQEYHTNKTRKRNENLKYVSI